MITIAAFSEMLSLIYAAAVSPELWDEAIAHVHHAFATATVGVGQARCTTLAFADGVSRSMTGTLDPEADRAYGEHYGHLDYVLQAIERGPVGVLRTGTELITPRTHTEFYADWIRPNDLGDGMFVRLTNDAKPTSFVIAGSPASEPFDTEERTQLLTMLVPHLQQALRTQNGLSGLSWRTGELAEALDSVEHGIVIVTSDSRLVHGNAAAEQLLAEGDGLVSHAGRLVASAPHMRARLEALLHFALGGDALGIRHGGSLACGRASGQRPYAVHVLPMNRLGTEFAPHGPTAIVLIVDPERRPIPGPDMLRQLFGLTKTEVAVAQLVVNGEGLGPIGEQLQLSRDTVKTHLRNVFNKTGTHRQAELVRLLLVVTA
jgi:DNA-binding CsgD family transcriptional regulator/PAS domain-containing protein